MWTGTLRAPFLALLAAGLLAAGFQPLDLGPVLGWIALLPLLAALQGQSRLPAFGLGWLFGLGVNLSLFTVVLPIPNLHLFQVLPVCAFLACFPAAWCALMAGTGMHSPRLPWLGAALWVLLDYAKSHAGFMAFPIGSLAQAQVDDTWLLQAASMFGEAAVSFLVVLGNLAFWRALHGARRIETAWCAAPIALALGWGALAVLPRTQAGPAVSVAVLQTAFPAFGAGHVTTAQRMRSTADFLRTRAPAGATLLVLPESSFINPGADPALVSALQQQADAGDLTLVAGVAQALKFDRAPGTTPVLDGKVRAGAWIFQRNHPVQRYDKVHRLAFAEYLPLRDWVAWPRWLVPPPLEVVEARRSGTFPIASGGRMGIMVCWESAFASHAARLSRQGAGVLLQLSNEGWFSGTAAGLRHNATVRLRAVETRRPVLASVNAGPAIIVDRFGRVQAQGSPGAAMQWITATVQPATGLSVYTRIGDLFVLICALAAVLLLRPERRAAIPRSIRQPVDLP